MKQLDQSSRVNTPSSFEIINDFRRYGFRIGVNTMNISGNMITKIYQEVNHRFVKAAVQRNEKLLRSQLDSLVLHLMRVYGDQNYQIYLGALDFEVEYYLNNGLRERDKIDHKVHGYSDPCLNCGVIG